MVKNPPAMQETLVRFLGQEDLLEKGKYPLQYSGLENSMDSMVHGVTNSGKGLRDLHFHSCIAGRFFTILATREAPSPEEIATEILIIL